MLELETGLFFWTVVSFGLLTVLLYKVALPPLLAFLLKRENLIAGSLEQSAANQKESEQLLAEYKKKLADVHKQAESIVSRARDEARTAREEIIANADRQSQRIMEKNRQELAHEKEKILREVKGEVAEMVVQAAGRVLQREVSARDNLRIIEEIRP
jgi:F-type H+-transporting ATPase subunit b